MKTTLVGSALTNLQPAQALDASAVASSPTSVKHVSGSETDSHQASKQLALL